MGLRFRKSFKIAPGVRFNLSKKSMGLSFGGKGARFSVNSSGRKTASVGIPGTGISYTKNLNTNHGAQQASKSAGAEENGFYSENHGQKPPKPPMSRKKKIILICIGIFVGLALIGALGNSAKQPEESKTESLSSNSLESSVVEEQSQEESVESTETESSTITESSNTQAVTNQESSVTLKPATEPSKAAPAESSDPNEGVKVYRTKTGKRYHFDSTCGNGTYYECTLADALGSGLTPCEKCAQ